MGAHRHKIAKTAAPTKATTATTDVKMPHMIKPNPSDSWGLSLCGLAEEEEFGITYL